MGVASGVRATAGGDTPEEAHHPDAIIGDLDSIEPEVLAFYRGAGCSIHDLSHDQDSTDLMKCVEYARSRMRRGATIIAAGVHAAGGGGMCGGHGTRARGQGR